MQKYVFVALALVVAVGAYGFYALQGDIAELRQLTAQVDYLRAQATQGGQPQGVDLTEEQVQQLNDAFQGVIDARRELVDTQAELGLLSEEEAQFLRDHLQLMEKYRLDLGFPGGHGMLGRMGGPRPTDQGQRQNQRAQQGEKQQQQQGQ